MESSRRKEIKNEPHSINILIGALPGPTRIIPQVSQVSILEMFLEWFLTYLEMFLELFLTYLEMFL